MRTFILTTVLLTALFAHGGVNSEQGLATAGGAPVPAASETAAANVEVTAAAAAASIESSNALTAEPTKAPNEAAAKIENKKESEIPLSLETPKKGADDTHPLFKILLVVSLMGAVGTGAFIFLRKYSKTNFAAGKANQIKIITQHHLGPKKSLAIIRVAGESILIGITDQNINMIKSLSLLDDEVPEATPNHFSDVFGSGRDGLDQDMPAMHEPQEEDEEFSIRGVKDAVSKKLKGMRSFQ